MTKILNNTIRLLTMLLFAAPVAYTANLMGNAGVTIYTLDYWLSVGPIAFICGLAWGMVDSRLEEELQ